MSITTRNWTLRINGWSVRIWNEIFLRGEGGSRWSHLLVAFQINASSFLTSRIFHIILLTSLQFVKCHFPWHFSMLQGCCIAGLSDNAHKYGLFTTFILPSASTCKHTTFLCWYPVPHSSEHYEQEQLRKLCNQVFLTKNEQQKIFNGKICWKQRMFQGLLIYSSF